MSKDWNYHLKIAIIGDSGSGKSYITNRYLNNDDAEHSDLQTVNFGKKYIQIGNKVIYIKIYDTSGKAMHTFGATLF